MKKHDDILACKNMAINYLYFEIELTELSPIFVQHPIFENGFMYHGGEMLDIITNRDALSKAREFVREKIEKAESIDRLLFIIRTPYQLTFLRDIRQYVTKKTFSRLLGKVWVASENPNQDVNVSTRTAVRWFRTADKEALMNPEDLNVYNTLPDTVTVYRGVAEGRNPQGLSWTVNLETAKWFAKRFGEHGYVQYGTVNKEDILAYFNTRSEDELVVDPTKVQNVSVLTITANCNNRNGG